METQQTVNNLWMLTASGRKLYPLNPLADQITIRDIAKSLSNICRFTGHCEFYSVAQHSVLVSQLVNPDLRLQALLHDASEFALNDLNSRIKHSGEFETYIKYEHQLQQIIFRKFGSNVTEDKQVKIADQRVLEAELRDLMRIPSDYIPQIIPAPFIITPLPPDPAYRLFLHTFRSLVSPEAYEKWMAE